ncbi:neuroligin-3 [Trichonephila clavipes]|nr:neuroligin-3 [Trichonephila clavipes]
MRISHKRLTIRKTTFAVLLPIYGYKCWKKSSKIERPDWTTSELAVAVICQESYLKSLKPKVRDHYHAHRLSFWLSLIPKLHRQGTSTEVASQHHLLDDHDNPNLYDGVVRQGSVLPPIGN